MVLATVLPLAVLAAHTELLGPVTTTRNLIFLLPVYVLMLALGGAALGRRAIALVPRAEGYVRGTGLAFAVLLTVGLVYAERVERRTGSRICARWRQPSKRQSSRGTSCC